MPNDPVAAALAKAAERAKRVTSLDAAGILDDETFNPNAEHENIMHASQSQHCLGKDLTISKLIYFSYFLCTPSVTKDIDKGSRREVSTRSFEILLQQSL